MIDLDDYCIRYINLPVTTKGMTVQDGDGFYNIYINANLSAYAQKEAIQHELRHVQRGDFDNKKSLLEAETM